MACGAACRLHQTGLVSQKAFLVRIENAHQRDLRQVQALSQQVDAYQDIHLAGAQFAQNLHAFDGVYIGMDVFYIQPCAAQVVPQVFRRALGEGGDEHALSHADAPAAELDGFVDLPLQRQQGDARLRQAGGADELLHDERLPQAGRVEVLHRGIAGMRCDPELG